jgi:hypothetical protein
MKIVGFEMPVELSHRIHEGESFISHLRSGFASGAAPG